QYNLSKKELIKMADKNTIFEDVARISTNVATTMFESAQTAQNKRKEQTQSFAKNAELITRDEFEVIRRIALKAKKDGNIMLKEVEDLQKTMQAISSTLNTLKPQVDENAKRQAENSEQNIFSE